MAGNRPPVPGHRGGLITTIVRGRRLSQHRFRRMEEPTPGFARPGEDRRNRFRPCDRTAPSRPSGWTRPTGFPGPRLSRTGYPRPCPRASLTWSSRFHEPASGPREEHAGNRPCLRPRRRRNHGFEDLLDSNSGHQQLQTPAALDARPWTPPAWTPPAWTSQLWTSQLWTSQLWTSQLWTSQLWTSAALDVSGRGRARWEWPQARPSRCGSCPRRPRKVTAAEGDAVSRRRHPDRSQMPRQRGRRPGPGPLGDSGHLSSAGQSSTVPGMR